MISKISSQLRKSLKAYHKYWLKVGLSTQEADRERSESAICSLYKIAGLIPPQFTWCASPRSSVLAQIEIGGESLGESLNSTIGISGTKDYEYLEEWDKIGEHFSRRLNAALEGSLRASVWDSVCIAIWFELEDFLEHVCSLSNLDVSGNFWLPGCHGQHDAAWIAYRLFRRDVLGLEDTRSKQLELLVDIAESCGWWWPFERRCVVSDRPNFIRTQRWRNSFRLHCETGPAVRYPDGWGIYVLHGVRVPKEVVVTPADELDPRLLLKERNAQVRREIVRKIGIERVYENLGAKTLDSSGNYELVQLDLEDGRGRPYLKMINPSTGLYHLEGVHPDCDTVAVALAWRNGTEVPPIVLT